MKKIKTRSNKKRQKRSARIERWILENVFQKFSDFTYRYIRTTNFFWALISILTTLVSLSYLCYVGLFEEKDPLVLLIPPLLIPIYIMPAIYSFKKAWYGAYDRAVYGKENEFKKKWADTRAGALVATTTTALI